MYVRFRRQALREGRHFQSDDAATLFLNRSLISSDEVDVLLLVMLRNARRIIQHAEGRRLQLTGQYDWLESIRGRYLTQVFVDEATDFSAVQLGCTIELSDPRLRSWFACGDLRQRITANGIQDDAEIAWLDKTTGVKIDLRRVDIGYRQSRRLRELSDALAGLLETGAGATRAPPGDDEADAWPLLGESLSGDGLAQWLADRIHEVERGIGRLPSIAVFVDGDDLIDPLIDATKPLLEARNIPIVRCKEGRVAGDDQEVRVFDAQHIKGLEFEAVFFIGIDRLAERIPDLFQRFLYVGVTRAATYLGLTCERELPKQFEALRPNFGAADWSDG
jgi:superfamily I DNA/RNA helicase